MRHALKRMSRDAERHRAMRDGRGRKSVPADLRFRLHVSRWPSPEGCLLQESQRRLQGRRRFSQSPPRRGACENRPQGQCLNTAPAQHLPPPGRMLALGLGLRVECATTASPLFTPGRRNQRKEEQDAPRIRQTGICRTATLRTFWAPGLPRNARRGASCVLLSLGGPGNRAALAFPGKEAPERGCCSGVFAFSWGRRTQKPSRRSFNQGIPSWRTKRSGSGSKRTIIV